MEYPDTAEQVANQEISHIHYFSMSFEDWLKKTQLQLLDDIIQQMTNPKVLFINHDHPYAFKSNLSWEWVTKSLG